MAKLVPHVWICQSLRARHTTAFAAPYAWHAWALLFIQTLGNMAAVQLGCGCHVLGDHHQLYDPICIVMPHDTAWQARINILSIPQTCRAAAGMSGHDLVQYGCGCNRSPHS